MDTQDSLTGLDSNPPAGDPEVVSNVESLLDDIIDDQEEILESQHFKMEE